MLVKNLKVYQAVKIGSKELTYLSSPEYKIEFKPEYNCVVINGDIVVPMNNIPWLQIIPTSPQAKTPSRKPKEASGTDL